MRAFNYAPTTTLALKVLRAEPGNHDATPCLVPSHGERVKEGDADGAAEMLESTGVKTQFFSYFAAVFSWYTEKKIVFGVNMAVIFVSPSLRWGGGCIEGGRRGRSN